jgi:adenylate cyclase
MDCLRRNCRQHPWGLVAEWLVERRSARPVLVNFAGPLLYSLVETAIEGPIFFQQWHHQAYWSFALAFAVVHGLQARVGGISAPLVIAENILRSTIPLVIYALFEARSKGSELSVAAFLADHAHVFLAIVLLLVGSLLGFADLGLRRTSATTRSLALRLRRYSEWSMGRDVLDRAIADEATLALQRVERAVFFMDIRGFTAWSEKQSPEAVVAMLNGYYRAAESALGELRPIKLKFTADEVMAVFVDGATAAAASRCMLAAAQTFLAASRLGVGAGLHYGRVVEGVLGGDGAKAYDFIGDTVNTAQRLCDAAAAGEVLISLEACTASGTDAELLPQRKINAKGKREPLPIAVLVAA